MKEKRKARLDKKAAGSSEFIGFGAFASGTSSASGVFDSTGSAPKHSKPIPTPVFEGTDPALQQVFHRISQKRDGLTKTKALQELANLLETHENKWEIRVHGLPHWMWLYTTKLSVETSVASIRATSLLVWQVVLKRVPKAVFAMAQAHSELWGIWYAATVDPAQEVRHQASNTVQLATQVWEEHNQQSASLKDENDSDDPPWRRGVLDYSSRILGYTRPSTMYEALFAKNKTDAKSLSADQKEDAEERFQFLTGLVLDSLCALLSTDSHALNSRESPIFDATSSEDYGYLLNFLNSPFESLRQRTLRLVALMASMELPPQSTLQKASNQLMQRLSTEKLPNVWPALLEALFAVAVFFKKDNSVAANPFSNTAAWKKPLIKAFRKACYGASVQQWGPILLPMTSTLAGNDLSLALELVQAAWEGQHVTLGMSEAGRLATAVAETAHFELLKKRAVVDSSAEVDAPISAKSTDLPQTSETAMAMAEIWLQVLENALSDNSLSTGNARLAAWEPLLKSLAKQLQRFQDEPVPPPNVNPENAFAMIQETFWVSKLSWPCTHPEALAFFVKELSSNSKRVTRLGLVAKSCFAKLLAPYQESSGDFPKLSVYQAVQALVEYFPSGLVTERFVMNDLLRWVILHVTSASYRKSHDEDMEELVGADFIVLALALQNREQASSWWSTIVKEVLAAKPQIALLTLGLDVLVAKTAEVQCSQAWISSPILDKFAKQYFLEDNSAVSLHHQLDFCRTLLGLKANSSSHVGSPIISDNVWEFWIDTYRKQTSETLETKPALAQILLEMTKVPRAAKLLDKSSIESIILQSWLQEKADISQDGGHHYTDILSTLPSELVGDVVAKASSELRLLNIDFEEATSTADWGLRACRLVEMCQHMRPERVPDLSLVGLADISAWKKDAGKQYTLIRSLFRYLTEKGRAEILINSPQSVDLFLAISVGISEASANLVVASKVASGDDNTAIFLESFGQTLHEVGFLDKAITTCMENLSSELTSPQNYDSLRLASVLSILLRSTFGELEAPFISALSPSAIQSGDSLWYITDSKNPDSLEPATVVKSHYDAVAGHYYTISVEREDGLTERQTVLERLRLSRAQSKGQSEPISRNVKKDKLVREKLVSSLIQPHFASQGQASGIHELVNALVSNVGVGSERGIGSSHFWLFQILSQEAASLKAALEGNDHGQAEESLWKLALSFGYGRNNAPREGTFFSLALDHISINKLLLDKYNDSTFHAPRSLSCAMLAWFSISIPALAPDEGDPQSADVAGLVFSISKQLLTLNGDCSFSSDSMVALKAFDSARIFFLDNQRISQKDGSVSDKYKKFLVTAIEAFSIGWQSEHDSDPVWKKYSKFPSIIEHSTRNPSSQKVMGDAITPTVVESLSKLLFLPSSRKLAFNILECYFSCGKVLYSEDEIKLNDSTKNNLKVWTQSMDVDAASGLEEDVEVVSQWLPACLMEEVEDWRHETFEDLQEDKTLGRLLVWLSILRVVNAAAPEDFRSRPAFVSYLTKAEAVPTVLNVSILFDRTLNSPKAARGAFEQTPSSFEGMDDQFKLDILSSEVIFRTFESLPSLCRRWWEEECPKAYTQRVQSYVERNVAPQILTRELHRMQESAKNFGDMHVSGSKMSREVTAKYIQDDFTLTVLIRLPPAFPLRSAEVDCSRTLGIPMNRWKRWSLQITQMLNNQGGTLQDALLLWKNNVDKEFDGVEPCPVCYSVLHVKTHKLPSLECTTCHNRFHVDCLQQWFKSSGKSQCVLCQQDWRGVRV